VAAQTSSEDEPSNPLTTFVERLAANLGIAPDELTSAVERTRDEMVDEAVANGDLTPERGEALKAHDLDELLQRLGDGFERHFDRSDGGAFGWSGPDGDEPHPFHHGLFGLGGLAAPGALAQAADAIGIDVRTLLEEMSDGKSLAEVAADHGVTRDELKQSLLDDYSASLDEFLDRSFDLHRFEDRDDREPSATPAPSGTASATATAGS
jgi:hypothetical protein